MGEYKGNYKDGKYHGQGTYTWDDGDKYEGEWKQGKKHGYGIYTHFNGVKYVGEWKQGKKHGHGSYTWDDGEKYVGEWKQDKKHGHGIYTYADGEKSVGEWKDGELLEQERRTSTDREKYENELEEVKINLHEGPGIELGMTMKEVEKRFILKTLHDARGNRTHAANTLGIALRTLRNKLNEFREDVDQINFDGLTNYEDGDQVEKHLGLGIKVGMSMKEVEKRFILKTLHDVRGNRTHAANTLGIALRTLRNKLNEFREDVNRTNTDVLTNDVEKEFEKEVLEKVNAEDTLKEEESNVIIIDGSGFKTVKIKN